MRLRILLQKINADFLQSVKAAMSIEITRIPLQMTYEQALMTFCNEVNRKHPPGMSSNNSRPRRVNEVNNMSNIQTKFTEHASAKKALSALQVSKADLKQTFWGPGETFEDSEKRKRAPRLGSIKKYLKQ